MKRRPSPVHITLLLLGVLYAGLILTGFHLEKPFSSLSSSGIEQEPEVTISYGRGYSLLTNASSAVHVACAADGDQFQVGLRASLFSMVSNSAEPRAIHIHLFELQADGAEGPTVSNATVKESLLLRVFGMSMLEWMVKKGCHLHHYFYSKQHVRKFVNPHVTNKRLMAPSNYVRYLLPDRLPRDVNWVLWLDSDTIVNRDIVPWLRLRNDSLALAALPRRSLQIKWKMVIQKLKARGLVLAERRRPSFNAGVIVMNIRLWRINGIVKKVVKICKANENLNLWPEYGSQPPLLLLFSGDRFEKLGPDTITNNLGFEENVTIKNSSIILHWNGAHKPWNEDGYYREHWIKYNHTVVNDNAHH
jgi:lipopolysaccharide biosynthesis glycosyltransferase